jgi:hypothetical protein
VTGSPGRAPNVNDASNDSAVFTGFYAKSVLESEVFSKGVVSY